MIQRYDIEKAMSSVSLIISGLHICFLASCILFLPLYITFTLC
ncbi:hypothetical protein BACCELL_03276 [Bacteroides cellulosilyticus DSM 14838]|uniref:Uncharacterized protein n=1 Tax=Bacteroides cellulosilyticus DSM 14838 TaxID=537012 RepID=E2NG54_9BACE|nr:hypothetical protein BACCELL_03276 [Bacteroides cellulosilyticus DSM 14838]